MNVLCLMIDGAGVYGSFLHYGLVIAFVGSALMAFLYCWQKGKLNMDEEPKFQMMQLDNQSKQVEETHE